MPDTLLHRKSPGAESLAAGRREHASPQFAMYLVNPQTRPLTLEVRTIKDFWVDNAERTPARCQVYHPLADRPADITVDFVGQPNRMGRQQNIVQTGKAVRP